MGSCVSLQKNSKSAAKLPLPVDSKKHNIIVPSPVEQNSVTLNTQDHAVMSQRSLPPFRNDGSKDEAFFDSQPWLESDCEDDFVSVNGDFTPSRGSTPVHHRFSYGNPTVSKPLPVPVPQPEPSPKKRLSELFKDSLRYHQDGNDVDEASNVVIENGASNKKTTAIGVLRPEKLEKSEKYAQCCLPRLRSSRSSRERKRKTSFPNGTS